MTTPFRPLALLAACAATFLSGTHANAQQSCNPLTAGSREAKLLGLFANPLAFSAIEQPARLSAGVVVVVIEGAQIPKADGADRLAQCGGQSRVVNSNLTDAVVRPRLLLGLGQGFAAEVSWLPPLTVGKATPNLYSAALSWTLRAGMFAGNSLRVQFRGHITRGEVRGPVICSASDLRPDVAAPCYGTAVSKDAYRPNVQGGEALLAVDGPGYGFYVGSGINAMAPELRIDFTNGAGVRDTTRVVAPSVSQYPILLGGSIRFTDEIALLGQYYIIPSTTSLLRVGASIRLR